MASSTNPSPRTIFALYGILAYQGYTMAIIGIAAPFIATSFGLNDTGIATLYTWIALAALGVLLLARLADRIGRRRVLLVCTAATPGFALAAASARHVVLFALCAMLLYAFIGGAISSAVTMLAEVLPMERRAHGQSYGGLAAASGAGLCLVLMPLLDSHGLSWRWLLVISGGGLLQFPLFLRAIPETHRWRSASDSGAIRATAFLDLFSTRYRARAAPILICMVLTGIATFSADAWSYYHAVSSVHLSAATASALVLVGGGVSLLGFPLGAWSCDTFGRVPTVVIGWLLAGSGALCFFWGPPAGSTAPAVWLGVAFCWFKTADNAAIVGFRSASTELFPTALRGTMMGWAAFGNTAGLVVAQLTIALLAAPLGGLSRVVGYLAFLTLPSAFIFGRYVSETRGLSLEVAANETAG